VSTRTRDLVRFGLLGAAIFLLLAWVQTHWLDICAWLLGRDSIAHDEQPDWLRRVNAIFAAIPWLIGAALFLFALLRRRWVPFVAFAGAQLLGIGLMFTVLFGSAPVNDYLSRVAFDSTAWKAENRGGAEGVRVHMVDDLLRIHRLVGLSRVQLEELLGRPPATEYFPEYDYVYWLGPERGPFSIDSEWLVIKFREDRVASARVVTD
jgi:hypothetical protein